MIKGLYSAYINVSSVLKTACISEIKNLVNKNDGRVDLPTEDERCYVTYDGGNHPEYSSGFRAIDSVIDRNGVFYAVTEDDEWEELDYFSADDLHEIYLYTKSAVE